MAPSRLLAGLGALGGLALIYFQSTGIVSYMERGASTADAFTTEVILILSAGGLVFLGGLLSFIETPLRGTFLILGFLLQGFVLIVTAQLGIMRPVWLVGAIAVMALGLSFVLRLAKH